MNHEELLRQLGPIDTSFIEPVDPSLLAIEGLELLLQQLIAEDAEFLQALVQTEGQ